MTSARSPSVGDCSDQATTGQHFKLPISFATSWARGGVGRQLDAGVHPHARPPKRMRSAPAYMTGMRTHLNGPQGDPPEDLQQDNEHPDWKSRRTVPTSAAAFPQERCAPGSIVNGWPKVMVSGSANRQKQVLANMWLLLRRVRGTGSHAGERRVVRSSSGRSQSSPAGPRCFARCPGEDNRGWIHFLQTECQKSGSPVGIGPTTTD